MFKSIIPGVTVERELLSGSYGSIFKGLWHQKTKVVIKVPRYDVVQDIEDVNEKFKNEVEIHRKIKHPNIVEYLFDSGSELLMEYIESGDLITILENHGFSEQDQRKIMMDIIHGLNYLHQEKIIHADMKPENILIQHDASGLRAKICDFGFAIQLKPSEEYVLEDPKGTLSYIAPEIWNQRYFSTKADVYAFSLIMYVIITRNLPFDIDLADEKACARLISQIGAGLRPTISDHVSPVYKLIMTSCWVPRPTKRMALLEVEELLNSENTITATTQACLTSPVVVELKDEKTSVVPVSVFKSPPNNSTEPNKPSRDCEGAFTEDNFDSERALKS